MKKIKNILFILLAIFSMFFTSSAMVLAETPSNFKIDSDDIYMLYGADYLGHNSTLNLTFKKTTDGKIVYCIEPHDDAIHSGIQSYTLSKEMSAKFAYVLANGYPNVSITGNNNMDYYITGLAVWYLINPNDTVFTYFDLNKGTYKGYDSKVVKEVAKLVNGANSYSYIEPSIKISTDSSNLTLSSDGKYYISSAIGVKAVGINNNYKVSLENAPQGTIVTDKNGNKKESFAVNETFIVKVPTSSISSLSSEFKVNVTAKGNINKAYSYDPSNAKYQSVVALYPESKNIADTINLKINLTTEVQISKVDATTNKELPGATLTVKDANGKVIETWVSTEEVHIIKGLKPGKYTLTEEIAPEGYILSTETITFEIKSDGTVTKVVMKNYLEDQPVPIYISKQDITTGEELPGAHLELKNEKGELIAAWVSTDEPKIIEGLEPGKYILSEILAPEGYDLNKETVEFIVKEDGTVDGKIIMYNSPEIVEVPSTSSFKTITASLIGIIIIGLGSMVIYKNYRKNEKN